MTDPIHLIRLINSQVQVSLDLVNELLAWKSEAGQEDLSDERTEELVRQGMEAVDSVLSQQTIIDRLRNGIRKLEYAQVSLTGRHTCYACGRAPTEKHSPGCPISQIAEEALDDQ